MTDQLIEWLRATEGLSVASGAVLVSVFVVANFILMPRNLLAVSAGALYGLSVIAVIVPSATAGATLAFLAARYLFSARLQPRIDRHQRLRAIANAIDKEGWRIVALMRIASPIPSTVGNYLFGLTRIGLLPFALTTFVFIIPQTALFVYIGYVGRAALIENSDSPLSLIVVALGAISVMAVFLLIRRRLRAATPG
ncbi:MAG: VTT domain-containing protein [Xanthobacteraceae bacterium]|nr:VTT domain-containing protein [Xanthobacteraceae bacterium]